MRNHFAIFVKGGASILVLCRDMPCDKTSLTVDPSKMVLIYSQESDEVSDKMGGE